MPAFSALPHDIYCLDACFLHEQVTSIYLLRAVDEVAIIDTGTHYSIDNVLATLSQLGIAKAQVKYVIPTHVHLDHAGGAGSMMRHFDQARLIIHPRGARHMANPEKLVAGTIAVYGEEKFERLYGTVDPIPEARMIVADDLDRFALRDRELLFIDTPGHARHHFCIYDQTSNGVFSGDTFGFSYGPMKSMARGLIPTTSPVQFDPDALHASVTRIMDFKPGKLYLTHFGEFVNPAAQISSYHRWIDEFVELCRRVAPDDEASEQALERELRGMLLEELTGPDSEAELGRMLKNDIRLNTQGLAHWWRSLPGE